MSNPECPRCGYSRARETEAVLHLPSTINELSVWAQQEDLTAVQAELRRIEDSIFSLEQSISRLIEAKCIARRRVSIMQAATGRLPPEILSIIFQLACPPIDFDTHYLDLEKPSNIFHTGQRFLYVLTAVSHHWWQVAFSTQQLWTSVRLEVDTLIAYSPVHKKLSLLDLHFQNTRNAPLSIELDFAHLPFTRYDSEDGSDSDVDADAIFDMRKKILRHLKPLQTVVFVDKAPMIRHLLLIRPPAE
ncbi:hypothetical protein AGABI2DRAFT_116515 [Agaricus bisporus var. bisporus H97]|uniref:hypothetical protein n=1 Tax=Agaricus bisporus var. bisporus (strain H97 / ATCC MYA-4626 / FGSC 10389) TaxID=936046 RepID=UPI00029F69A5|nr:hypothetical protein AGABI2DRAFT_116515 [Agaricus bisporus var. bisporus H97]EKV49477.1 hypothetical protein AGABI2DRAFT_116515 [Agaricus bisporus var. bisporus H97]